MADWQRKEKSVKSDFVVYKDNTNRQNSHHNLHLEKKNFVQRFFLIIKLFFSALQKYDIFHFYFGKTLLPFNLDLPVLKLFGKKVIMDYVGSDIRLFRVESRRNPYYSLITHKYFWDYFDLIKRIRMIWHGIWCDYCMAGKQLYAYAQTSIPEKKILRDLWVNTTLDVPPTLPVYPTRRKPMIIHAPSNFLTKGTSYVQEAVDDLRKEGLDFEFRIFHKVPHEEFIHFMINEADIVVDQLLSGGFGILAMEAMTYGKPVCGYVSDELVEMFPDLPIVNCTIDSIKDQLRILITHPEKRKEISRRSWEFAKKHYDRDAAYEQLWQIYLKLWNSK